MFNKGIYETALIGEVADRLFTNITAPSGPDQSFLATLRVLLSKRLPQNEIVRLDCKKINAAENYISALSVSDCMNFILSDEIKHRDTSGYSILIIYTAQLDAGQKMLEIVRANVGAGKRYMINYARRDDLKVFYARKTNCLFYTDVNNRHTVIFTDRLELKHFHTLQMMIPKYIPLLFRDNPLTEKETALLKSTGNKSAAEYETLIEEFVKDLDIRSEIIRTKLAGFEIAYERVKLDRIKLEISGYERDYEHYVSMLSDLNNNIQERKYTLAGLECAITKHPEDSELMEYFMCNKNLSVMSVNGTAIEFVAHGHVDIYDEEAFERYVNNRNGYMYNNVAVNKIKMEMLYRAIFGERWYKLRICAAYKADMNTGMKALSHYAFPPESRTYLPNPHIQNHGCIGNYAGRFQEYMKNRDYVGGIDQAVVSARNLNFYDSAVMSSFAGTLSRSNIKCVEKPDGTLLTPAEAIKELEGGME